VGGLFVVVWGVGCGVLWGVVFVVHSRAVSFLVPGVGPIEWVPYDFIPLYSSSFHFELSPFLPRDLTSMLERFHLPALADFLVTPSPWLPFRVLSFAFFRSPVVLLIFPFLKSGRVVTPITPWQATPPPPPPPPPLPPPPPPTPPPAPPPLHNGGAMSLFQSCPPVFPRSFLCLFNSLRTFSASDSDIPLFTQTFVQSLYLFF